MKITHSLDYLRQNRLVLAGQLTNGNIVLMAEYLARVSHNGQYRRDGVTPYINHVEGVVKIVASGKYGRPNPALLAVAWLHDVIEDTELTLNDLYNFGFSLQIIRAVDLLTHHESHDYDDYIRKIRQTSKNRRDVNVMIVKLADIEYNMNDVPTDRQRHKYERALSLLNWEIL